jgi:hypothetical protein
MKTSILVLLMLFLFRATTANAQWINSITMVPANPTEIDTIYFYAHLSFPSGPCADKTITTTSTPPNLFANAIHCLGPLTVICDHTDTIVYYQLPPGNYSFIFQVDAGAAPSPCTPGIMPGPVDSINFTVLPIVSVNELSTDKKINIYPNPAGDYLKLEAEINFEDADYLLKIFSADGKLLKEIRPEENKYIDISELKNGIYFCTLIKNKSVIQNSKFIIHK